jgi:hypothetical protein
VKDLFESLMKDPGIRADIERRDAERRVRAAEVMLRYGTEDAVFADTPREAALRRAFAPFTDPDRDLVHYPSALTMEPEVRAAIVGAWPFPATVAEALAEYDASEAIGDDRAAVEPNWSPETHVDRRRRLLEHALDTLPAASFADLAARVEWMQRVLDFGFSRDHAEDQACLDALKADVASLAAGRFPLPDGDADA